MAAYVEKHPPSEPFVQRRESVVYMHPFARLRIGLERTSDIGYGLWREDHLAEHQICGAQIDSKAFADGLVEALADHMSIRNLRDLLASVQAELCAQEASRRASMARLSELDKPAGDGAGAAGASVNSTISS